MSDRREREKRREERERAEASIDAEGRRTRILQMAAGAVFLAIAAVLVVIVVSSTGGGGDASNIKDASVVDSLLAGVPQQGTVLGDPKAPVELIEFGDLQCPVCKAYSEEILPPLIEGPVAGGKATIEFRNYTIIGEQSAPAGAAALAAGAQGRGWNYIELFYRNQGAEDSGYADDEFLTAVARSAGVEDISRWNQERKGSKFTGEVKKTTEEAQRLGLTGTPSFAIKGPSTNGLELLGTLSSPGEFEAAIEKAT